MIVINIDKAKAIAHDIRRAKRAEEFAPLDDLIAKRIPGSDLDAAEAKRQSIRDRYAVLQQDIEAASTIENLTGALAGLS